MLSKDIISETRERLFPMYVDALSRLSFGLEIMSCTWVCLPQGTPAGIVPMYGIVYQCRGRLLGSTNYISQISGVSDPFVTQQQIDHVIQEGCEQLRQNLIMQSQAANGGKQ